MELFLNRVWATLATGVDGITTTLPLTAGHGTRFGTISPGNKVRIVLLDASKNVSEIMYVTAVSGDNLTVTRGQDGTSGTNHLAGDRLEVRIGKSTLDSFMQAKNIQDGAATLLGSVAGVNVITATANPTLTAQAATGSLWKLPAAGANTGAVTLNIDGQGAVAVVRPDGTALQVNDIPSVNYPCLVEKRAADFVLINPSLASQLVSQTHTAFTTGGIGTAYTLTPTLPLNAYSSGIRYRVKFHATAGVSPTINVSGLGPVGLARYNYNGVKVACNAVDITANMLTDVEYDGTDFIVLNPVMTALHATLDATSTVVTKSVGDNSTAPASTAFCQAGFVKNDTGGSFGIGVVILAATISTSITVSPGGAIAGSSLVPILGYANANQYPSLQAMGTALTGTWRNITYSIGYSYNHSGTPIAYFQRIA